MMLLFNNDNFGGTESGANGRNRMVAAVLLTYNIFIKQKPIQATRKLNESVTINLFYFVRILDL